MRWIPALALLCACHKLFGLEHLPDAPRGDLGCADGTREGFTDLSSALRIAGCGGAWTIGGIKPAPAPACGRRAGNTGANLLGTDCTPSDLCAAGWHLCIDRFEVLQRAPGQTCAGISAENAFFATSQSGPGGGMCDALGTNDVFGCGKLGAPISEASCTPLDRSSGNDCSELRGTGGWDCLGPEEPTNLRKADPLVGGGVLCCAD